MAAPLTGPLRNLLLASQLKRAPSVGRLVCADDSLS